MVSPNQRMSPLVQGAISIFILVHLYIIVTWGLPGSRFRTAVIQPVQDYVINTGLWHSWDMFSPEPLAVNFHLEAEITYADGARGIWEFPRMEKLGLWERFQKERYRKWRERVRQDSYSPVWADTARYIARLHNNPVNPPRRIVLIRHWEPISPPIMDVNTTNIALSRFRDYQPFPTEWPMRFQFRFMHYEVTPKDLE